MAKIRILSWNIQVYGPKKYGNSVNNVNVAVLVGHVILATGAKIVVLQELMETVAEQVAFTVAESASITTGKKWTYLIVRARDTDRESYAILCQTEGVDYAPVDNGVGLASNQFPNNFSVSNGRRAAYAWFQTTDTRKYFVASSYHAPPNDYCVPGVEALGKMPEIYSINPGSGAIQAEGRLLGGDYNLSLHNNANHYKWLTDPTPGNPPPSTAGEGAGATASVSDSTILATLRTVVKAWGDDPAKWGKKSGDYVQADNCIDNLFCKPAADQSAVVDVVGMIQGDVTVIGKNAPSVHDAASSFRLTDDDDKPAFPNAEFVSRPLSSSLKSAAFAYVLYLMAVSDHLPVLAEVTL
jgi:endonuclease/exonuclease/phosphatase family metal-dependent hydrolase